MQTNVLPKIELHLHLDCSLSYTVVKKLSPDITREQYDKDFKATPKCSDLTDYISNAEPAIRLMQTREQLTLVIFDLFNQLKNDHVIYAEIRFAPLLHTKMGLTPDEVVQTVDDAVVQCVLSTGIEAGLILCTLRHFNGSESLETAKLVKKYRNTSVCGFDIARDEAGFPIDEHIRAFKFARENGLNCTSHAGEACGAKSVKEALVELKPSRIGHGVRSLESSALVSRLKSDEIHLEVCPTSNIKTRTFESYALHNVNTIYKYGISMSINTDGRTLSDITLEEEYVKLIQHFKWENLTFIIVIWKL